LIESSWINSNDS